MNTRAGDSVRKYFCISFLIDYLDPPHIRIYSQRNYLQKYFAYAEFCWRCLLAAFLIYFSSIQITIFTFKRKIFSKTLSLFIHLQGDLKEKRTIPIVHLIAWLVNVPHVVMMLSSPMLEMLVKILGQVQTHITPTYFLTSHCCSFLRQVFNQSETRTVSDMRELTNQSGGWWWSAADSVLHCCSVRGAGRRELVAL